MLDFNAVNEQSILLFGVGSIGSTKTVMRFFEHKLLNSSLVTLVQSGRVLFQFHMF